MQILSRDSIRVPDMPKVEMPEVDLPDLTKLDLPKIDIGKAAVDAATAVGLVSRRRSRWPFVLAAGVAAVAVGWAYMNAAMLRDRLSQARSWVGDRTAAMNPSPRSMTTSIRLRSPRPIRSPSKRRSRSTPTATTNGSKTKSKDYPDGFGATADMAAATGDETPAWEKASSRG